MTFPIGMLLIFLVLTDITLKKYIIAGGSKKISATIGKNINTWVKGLLELTAICTYFFVLDTTDYNTINWFWLIVFLFDFTYFISGRLKSGL